MIRLQFDDGDDLPDLSDERVVALDDAIGPEVSLKVTEQRLHRGLVDMYFVSEIAVVAGDLSGLAIVLMKLRERFRRGQRVDTSQEEAVVRPARELPVGSTSITCPDGTEVILTAEADESRFESALRRCRDE